MAIPCDSVHHRLKATERYMCVCVGIKWHKESRSAVCTKEGKHLGVSNTVGRWRICLGKGRRRAHITCSVRIHVGVGQRCRARDVESSTLQAKKWSVTFHRGPAGTSRVLAFCMQAGAGLYVSGTATLTNTNVYEDVAASVHLHFEPS